MQGQIDIPLNAAGQQQAHALARALQVELSNHSAQPITLVSSDLQRARQTAQAVAELCSLPFTLNAGLRERCYGGFEGLAYEDIAQRYPEAFARWRARDPQALFPSGETEAETLLAFHARAVASVTDIVRSHPAGTVIIVTHGGILDCLYREASGLALEAERDFGIINAAINRLLWDGRRFQLQTWAEADHLQAVGLDEIDRSHPAP
jgi:probable phosphoglycerate mutase